jgi:tryptophan synthase alpha chain
LAVVSVTVAAKGESAISKVFDASRAARRLQLMPFVPAGYPSLEATAAVLPALGKAGAGLIEVGIPFSDPIADGPVIQEAFTQALGQGVRLQGVLEMVRSVRGEVKVPLVAMVSYSIAFRRGLERFSAECREAGFDGLILPDLPPPEAQKVAGVVRAAGLDTVLLVAPTTPADRRATIAELSSGFIYYLSVAGITGERSALPADLAAGLAQMRSITKKPLCVGFGLSKAEHLKALEPHADGAIVGSALVRRMRGYGDEPGAVARAAGEFCGELLG